ncbi:ssDNA-binding phosphoprotein [NY_014 poxvirus]|uniref:ssDNA-binding phosphoprotein n=1 Tax=NY_014 poxvirus TaxID=2025360 RepID=UPI000B99F502|nr:ssDNA-binding phosphoprotein [NY_014 poxvirus]AST09465.1 ssDNA-binding phosphoprotein [NY_014 poxvirus]
MSKVVKKRDVKCVSSSSSDDSQTCASVIEFAKSISKSDIKCINYVVLNPSQYPSCSTISINLVDSLSDKMTSSYIMIEGESKIYKTKGKDDDYFLKVKVTASSPMLYQLLEAIYTNIRDKERIPNSLNNLSVDNITEKTFKDGCIYINRIEGAVVEYVSNTSQIIVKSIDRVELESLSKREKQLARLVITPIVFYRAGSETKVTFALKKIIMERDIVAKVITISGDCERVSMTENTDEDIVRNLGIMNTEEEEDEEEDDDGKDPLFKL